MEDNNITIFGDYIGNNIIKEINYIYPNGTVARAVYKKMEKLLSAFLEQKKKDNLRLSRFCYIQIRNR